MVLSILLGSNLWSTSTASSPRAILDSILSWCFWVGGEWRKVEALLERVGSRNGLASVLGSFRGLPAVREYVDWREEGDSDVICPFSSVYINLGVEKVELDDGEGVCSVAEVAVAVLFGYLDCENLLWYAFSKSCAFLAGLVL